MRTVPLHLVSFLAFLGISGCASTAIDLRSWDATSENVASMELIAEGGEDTGNPAPLNETQILFESKRAGNRDIWLATPGRTGLIQLTTYSGPDRLPSPHSNGRNFTFLSDRSGNPEYFLGEVGKPTAMSLAEATRPKTGAWSPARVSPDGQTLVYTSGSYVWLYDLETGRRTQLVEGYEPNWSPDGRKILISKVVKQVGTSMITSIWIMDKDGMNMTELVAELYPKVVDELR